MKSSLHFQGKTALITGASSGIGEATAMKLSREGMNLVLLARRTNRLETLAQKINHQGGKAGVITADLTLETERQRVYETIKEQYGSIDVLINNAGMGYYGFASEMPWEIANHIIQLNISAVVQLSLLFLKDMLHQGKGHIINIGSIVGKLPNQGVAIYSATKSFLDSFTTALFRELKGTPVHATIIRPGPVTTEFFDTAQQASEGRRRTPGEVLAISPERVADAILSVIKHPGRVKYVPGYLSLSPLLEITFGWLIDLVGPILLNQHKPVPVDIKIMSEIRKKK